MIRRFLAWLQRLPERMTVRLAWDLLMVYLAFLNLGLILFDWTYLWLRPTYFRTLPALTRLYDPVKGIEPHPATERYREQAETVRHLHEDGAAAARLAGPLEELQELSRRLAAENPFERSGQSRSLYRIQARVSAFLTSQPGVEPVRDPRPGENLARFWRATPEDLAPRVAFYERELEPLLAVNYYRGFDLDGQLIDYFWLIDLPFLTLFAVEFFSRWFLALRRRTYARWFLFPLFNWYDLLGIVPMRQFRVFRLFRIASIYMRLHRSEHSGIGDDLVSRSVRYFSNIISEEISDMVALRILNETQEEIRDGTHRRIIRLVAERHRSALVAELTLRVEGVLRSPGMRAEARRFLDANLEQAVESAEALRRLPLPDSLLRPLVAAVGEAVFDSLTDTLEATLAGTEGRSALQGVIAQAVDELITELTEGELEALIREIAIQVIDQMKEAVGVRKWALPDRPPRSVFTSSPRA